MWRQIVGSKWAEKEKEAQLTANDHWPSAQLSVRHSVGENDDELHLWASVIPPAQSRLPSYESDIIMIILMSVTRYVSVVYCCCRRQDTGICLLL